MTRSISESFYRQKAWKDCRNAYMSSKHYICERCGDVATICHHKEWLNDMNVLDPLIAYGFDNLEALCQTCHNKEHFGKGTIDDELKFDKNGNVTRK